MAEINSNAGHGRQKGGVRRSKKLSTRVDLTPMVDLGFLLITFFIFTTSMSRPKAMKLYLPADGPDIPVGETTVLTLVPIAGNKVFYYTGDLDAAIHDHSYGTSSFSSGNGIGDIIRQKQLALANRPRHSSRDLVLIIKPAIDARYQSVVAALDEVLINDVKHYAFVDINKAEKEKLEMLMRPSPTP